MKLIYTLLLSLLFLSSSAQVWNHNNHIDFDAIDTLGPKAIIIDTTYHNNVWQIGRPNKTAFTAAHSNPNALITDTVNHYPANDTSVFYIKIPAQHLLSGSYWGLAEFSFFYKLDIDSGEIAKVEMSVDSGTHWSNVLVDTIPYNFKFHFTTPDLAHSSASWQYFDLTSWDGNFYPAVVTPQDSIIFRFTFISDSIDTHKDGWMIDDMYVQYYLEGIAPLFRKDDIISIYPNPSSGTVYIKPKTNFRQSVSITIADMNGKEVYRRDDFHDKFLQLSLPDGMYIMKYYTDKEFAVKQLMIKK